MSDVATEARLLERLVQVLAWNPSQPYNEANAADAIKSHGIRGAVCCRLNGKVSTFNGYFAAIYGRDVDGVVVKPKAAKHAPVKANKAATA